MLISPELTKDIIGAAMEVHKTLGGGFLESVYEESLAIEFELRKIPYERQKSIDVFYKGRLAKHFVCDFLVYGKVIVETKAIQLISDVEVAQVLNYLKAAKIDIGLLLNFGGKSLKVKRAIRTQ
ncbi:MAG: GxxExxY protein [Planctomycetota bacterium]